ncbi:MAG TPA: diguanylate cyclase [Steroidobacteraceae bacterium]|nr:diguanylate cyclase [Steroidobacteraceae bacterium]
MLLAEDDPVARMLTARLLKKAGYEVTAVADGGEALEALKRDFYPVVLTDWEMPGIDGLGVVAAVRNGDWPGYVFTILLTGRDSRESVVAGLEAGADDYLTKPVDESELLARMKTGWRIADLEHRLRAAREQAVKLSLTDALTGVNNRRHFSDALPGEVTRARRFNRPLSLVICDIDHFKRTNDTYGHAAGDAVLQAFAALLGSKIRVDVDWVARFGGEEFVVVLPETDHAGALRVAERLRSATAALEVRHEGNAIRLTSSFGVASVEGTWPDGPVAEMLLSQADLCLYASKQQGRDRVTGECLAGPRPAASA